MSLTKEQLDMFITQYINKPEGKRKALHLFYLEGRSAYKAEVMCNLVAMTLTYSIKKLDKMIAFHKSVGVVE